MSAFFPTCVQLSHENEHEGLLPDCRVGVKKKRQQRRFKLNVGSTHGNLLSELWYDSGDRMTMQAASERGLLQVSTWHDRSYIPRIFLLAHGSTVKLTSWPCHASSGLPYYAHVTVDSDKPCCVP